MLLGDQRPNFIQIVAQDRRADRRMARGHPIHVAAQRVDLAVMGDHAERMGQFPAWEGISGKPLMHQGQA